MESGRVGQLDRGLTGSDRVGQVGMGLAEQDRQIGVWQGGQGWTRG